VFLPPNLCSFSSNGSFYTVFDSCLEYPCVLNAEQFFYLDNWLLGWVLGRSGDVVGVEKQYKYKVLAKPHLVRGKYN